MQLNVNEYHSLTIMQVPKLGSEAVE